MEGVEKLLHMRCCGNARHGAARRAPTKETFALSPHKEIERLSRRTMEGASDTWSEHLDWAHTHTHTLFFLVRQPPRTYRYTTYTTYSYPATVFIPWRSIIMKELNKRVKDSMRNKRPPLRKQQHLFFFFFKEINRQDTK